jgi:hypothetical protein
MVHTYKEPLQDYIQKNEVTVCDECSKIAEKSIVCVFCNVCVHPMSDCCCFVGDQLSCIDCHKTSHEYRVTVHAFADRASITQDLEDLPSQNLKALLVPNHLPRKEDERNAAAVNKKVEDAITKLKEPPKPVNDEDTEDDRKPPAKKDNKDSKRRPPKLLAHLSFTD